MNRTFIMLHWVFSWTKKQIVHAVQFQRSYCGSWQWLRVSVWHLHCRSVLLRLHQLSPVCFLMSSLLTFYQLSDNGITAGQAPSSTGRQWRRGSLAKICCMHESKRNSERDKLKLHLLVISSSVCVAVRPRAVLTWGEKREPRNTGRPS